MRIVFALKNLFVYNPAFLIVSPIVTHIMSDRHKARSRSGRIKGDFESSIIHIHRQEPIFVPKSIKFTRGTGSRARQPSLDKNSWVALTDPLVHIMSQECTMINDSHAQHRVPPPIETSVQGFLSAFERQYANIDDAMQCESIRSFVRSFGNIFSAHVILFLLYQSEKDISETIRANPLRNSPSIFLLRFLYFLPSLLKSEATDSEFSVFWQKNLEVLIAFATEKSDYFFVLPLASGHGPGKGMTPVKSEGASRVLRIVSKE